MSIKTAHHIMEAVEKPLHPIAPHNRQLEVSRFGGFAETYSHLYFSRYEETMIINMLMEIP